MDFGVNLQKSSVHPELLLVAMFGDLWVWFGLLSVKARTMSHLHLDSQHIAKGLQRCLGEEKKRNKKEEKGQEEREVGRERHWKVEDGEEAGAQGGGSPQKGPG